MSASTIGAPHASSVLAGVSRTPLSPDVRAPLSRRDVPASRSRTAGCRPCVIYPLPHRHLDRAQPPDIDLIVRLSSLEARAPSPTGLAGDRAAVRSGRAPGTRRALPPQWIEDRSADRRATGTISSNLTCLLALPQPDWRLRAICCDLASRPWNHRGDVVKCHNHNIDLTICGDPISLRATHTMDGRGRTAAWRAVPGTSSLHHDEQREGA